MISNNFIKFMTQLLLINIHPNPERRLSVNDTIKAFDEFRGNMETADVNSIENLIIHVSKNIKEIKQSFLINSKKIKTLTEKTIRQI